MTTAYIRDPVNYCDGKQFPLCSISRVHAAVRELRKAPAVASKRGAAAAKKPAAKKSSSKKRALVAAAEVGRGSNAKRTAQGSVPATAAECTCPYAGVRCTRLRSSGAFGHGRSRRS